MNKKRLLRILLSITLILGLTPGICMTARAATSYDLYIAGVQVTDTNKGNVLANDPVNNGKVSFDSDSSTLTLNGANITYDKDDSSAIQIDENANDLTIKLEGNNNVGPKNASLCCGISSKKPNITITGSGSDSDSLSVSGEFGIKSDNKTSCGNITIKNANVTATGYNTGLYADYGTITIKNSTFIANGTLNYGISSNSNSIFINNGKVTATGYSSGIKTQSGTINISGDDTTVIATGTSTVSNNGSSGIIIESNINDNSIIINGGTVIAEGKKGHGIISGDGGIIINGGTITATGGDGSGIVSSISLTITDGSVTASGTNKAISGNVKNSIKGTGWTNTVGTEGAGVIDINTESGQSLSYKKVQFPRPSAMVKTSPTANTLSYTGQPQPLVIAGAAEHGTMQYALGTETARTAEWNSNIPEGTKAGDYYVWYYAKGNVGYVSTTSSCIKVTIKNKPSPSPSQLKATVKKSPEVKHLTYNGKPQALAAAGEASGGTMQYALGTDSKRKPTDGWSENVPTGTDVGTYHVWYKVVGDSNHSDVTPKYAGATVINEPHSDNVISIDEEKGIATVRDDVSGDTSTVPIECITKGNVYRLYNPFSYEHLFTKNSAEATALINMGWKDESGSDYTGVNADDEDATPVYRLYNPYFGGMHLYTNTIEEARYLGSIG